MCGPDANTDDRRQSEAIDKKLKQDQVVNKTIIKLLLLGSGESGKSTIAKQMKILYLQGLTTKDELMSYRPYVFDNILLCIRSLVDASIKFGINLLDGSTEIAKRVCQESYFKGEFFGEVTRDIGILWNDPGIQQVFLRQHEFQLYDCAEYYLRELNRIGQKDYVPNVLDVLYTRVKTTGIIETRFKVETTQFLLVDVGGQRSERRKWLHCFQDVTAVIFCVAISEYIQVLYEDANTNRMHESLKLFSDVCNNKWFFHTDMILFLNKKDIFEKRIQQFSLQSCFPTYTGSNTYKEASHFIEDQFLSLNQNPQRLIYTHFTVATDTQNIQVVFNAVKDIIISKSMEASPQSLAAY